MITGLLAGCSNPSDNGGTTAATSAQTEDAKAGQEDGTVAEASNESGENGNGAAADGNSESKDSYNVGITFSDLSNPVWAELVQEAGIYVVAYTQVLENYDAQYLVDPYNTVTNFP